MRIEEPSHSERALHIIRRSGEVVVISESDVVKLKLIPTGSGKFRAPSAWQRTGSDEIEAGADE